jgi:NADH:ubiquinone oxidoreductase subunit 4 (subunit M)
MDDKHFVNRWPALLAYNKVEYLTGQMDRPARSVIDLVLVLVIWLQERSVHHANTWIINYQLNWIPSFGISFSCGIRMV